MFTWICPTCGRDVPPSMNECPNCSGKLKEAQEAERAPGQQVITEAPPAFAPPPPAPRPGGNAAGTWLMSLLFAAVFIAAGAGIYWGVRYWKSRPAATAASAPFENPAPAGAAAARPNALQKFIEITGVRLVQNAKKATEARFLIVNHSPAEVADLSGTVTLRAHGSAAGSTSNTGTFSFKSISLGPYEAKESSAVVNTTLRVYELPDWQNVIADLTITSP